MAIHYTMLNEGYIKMVGNDTPPVATATESGFVEVQTESGYTMNLFVLSKQDFNELKPTPDTYRQVAAMIGNKSEPYKPAPTNRERIQRIVKR